MQPPMNEQLPINDMFTERLKLTLIDYDKKSVTIQCNDRDLYKNPYGFAHGGFLYTIGHVAARNMALACLGRHMQVLQSTCQYLDMVKTYPIRAKARLLSIYSNEIVCETEVMDGTGNVCFTQTCILQDTVDDNQKIVIPKHYKGPANNYGGGKMLATGKKTTFEDMCHVSSPTVDKEGVHVKTDLYWDLTSDSGYVHQGVLFTLCDECAASCVALMQNKRPVTVSSSIHYLYPALVGPITATGRPMKSGNRLSYYEIIVRDGNGKKCAKAQYIMNCSDWPPQVKAMIDQMLKQKQMGK